MAAVASVGANIRLINHQKAHNSKHPSTFLGKKLKLNPNSKPSLPNPKALPVFSLKAELIDAVRDLFLGVGVGLPCTVMECGDVIYRSTLPKSNGLTIAVPGAVLARGALSYRWATRGVAPGFF
ncbi:hypothetical protein SLEP1_g51156 [Rubroshorea leprosula]|uniref:Uncharacterized protein n=1 Tax=Rubroshorea leprosula TaxID=152421 RepID=A0AAV5M3S1_9ROSI|nr:hypothetical protein SLEP1_g51156 [Rubroshorea leprosula]